MCLNTFYSGLTIRYNRLLVNLTLLTALSFQDSFANTYLGGILILVAFINASIDFYQIQKSEAILASFLAMIPPSCRVVRDGTIVSIAAADLVKGDVVLLVSFLGDLLFTRVQTNHLAKLAHW